MATTVEQLKRLRRENARLKKQIAHLKAGNGKRRMGATRRKPLARTRTVSERERAREILLRAGVIREMTAQEKKLAAEWDALPRERKQQVENALRGVQLDPPLSQLIHEMRR